MDATLTRPDGCQLFYTIDDFTDPWCAPETVLFVHGLAESTEAWRAWMPHFAGHYRCVRVDVRGFGRSTPMPKLPYDMEKDFAPITLAVIITSVVVVHPSVPATSIRELIALAKAKPGQLSYASTGNSTPTHLAAERFKTMTGVDMVHVPYKGASAAVVDLISGQTQVSFIGAPSVVPHLKAGRLRAPDVSAFLLSAGAEPVGLPPDQAAMKLRNKIARWAKVVKSAKMEVD